MANDDFSTFKIGDMRRASVRPNKPVSKATPAASEEEPLGFPAVEAHLESGSVESVAEALRASYEQLDDMSTGSDMRKSGAAKKAMGAYERSADLFEYLFQTKDALQNPSK
ncbi:unnamed protein product [Laminaria digitata]